MLNTRVNYQDLENQVGVVDVAVLAVMAAFAVALAVGYCWC